MRLRLGRLIFGPPKIGSRDIDAMVEAGKRAQQETLYELSGRRKQTFIEEALKAGFDQTQAEFVWKWFGNDHYH